MIQIEKGVPIRKAPVRLNLPFSEMSVGDSFFYACDRHEHQKIRQSAWTTGNRLQRKFSVRVENGGVRVWRVE